MSKVTQRFIVGTGRCGSTLLSTLMSHHPDALILSEFFGGLDVVNSWREGQLSGEEFASVRIPAIMLVCLPALTPDVEGLMREIVAFARSRPTATMGEHYAALFDWLTTLFKKQFWIERSGASSEFFPGQRAAFPEARFLHIHRGGHEVAMSMANMHHFQTHVGFYYDPPSDAEIANAIRGIDDGEGGLIPRRQKQLRTPEEFGRFWTLSVALILSEVKHLRPDQYCEVRFEDLHADPPAFLKAVCGYFGISAGDGWIAEAVATIQPERHQRAEALSPAARAALDLAVFPGNVLLKRDSLERPNRELYARIRRIWDEIEPSKAFAT
jgi:putative sulfotransferase